MGSYSSTPAQTIPGANVEGKTTDQAHIELPHAKEDVHFVGETKAHFSDEEEERDLEEAEDIFHHLLPPGSVAAADAHVNAPIPGGCPFVHDYVKSSWESDCPIYGVNHHYPEGRLHPPDLAVHDKFHPENVDSDPKQQPSVGQPFWLPTVCTVSGVPKSGLDHHWVYPSQQQFWNAMVHKGWKFESSGITPHVMYDLLLIHNAKNEQAWHEILKWEALHAHECTEPKLRSFGEGLIKKLSMRAHIRSWLGYELPYDRHDWVVDRCGKRVRYIIDYYEGEHESHSLEFSRLDVRPAFDTWTGVSDRMKVAWARWAHEFFDRPLFEKLTPKVDHFIEKHLWKKHSAFEKHVVPNSDEEID